MNRQECSRFDTCNAPLCPLDEKHFIWYPDEEICGNRKFSGEPWIKAQRKIAKATRDVNKYFTFAMLNQGCVIRSGITGLDPDSETSQERLEKKWLKLHPPKRELTEEEKEVARNRFEAIRKRVSRKGKMKK